MSFFLCRLNCCNLGKKSCKILGTTSLPLKELDLSSNDLQDSGVKLLSAGLNKAHSKLKTLRLSGCMVTGKGCSTLASALKSKPSHLKLLDLTYNYPGMSGMKLLSNLVPDLQMKHGDEIRLQLGLKKYACKLTLDPNTAHKHLSVSADERQVEHVKRQTDAEDHPDRFEVCEQVLSRESMMGRCYWEAEWKGDGASVAVSYSSIRREGNSDDSLFGFNNKSWSLHCTDNSFSVWHNNKETEIPVHTSSTRVAVYLDWKASILSFYSISPKTRTMTHLHTLQTFFSEPLYAGFYVSYNSSVCVCT
ncbi:stonustoxin subunit beta [Astyanax mexicanus]|uniref:stonustoxin subunit beta n=1 Tax=Astyanax mexicanus TaxID=7994 RepID=UPI0020CAE2D8|nr:stonustoxin subunit beta [Astyanax mexicanus]